ncbi:hypothetical protein RI845_00720 [Thalassotalea nanhaiensis]|uniref:Beta-carotene 15,15'-monooxygenase n=1 Tax=Thalassotalea nanhaiensis TaxID=3065648 RepID=A0ABY9TJ08_9GAMM|nr:hypothetical protein RI845_00720 [Colwelliaceae bacterium SQ345]
MTVITPETIILLAILVQALVISVVSPFRWGQQQMRLFQKYPPSQYPKFYVYSIKTECTLLSVRVLLDLIALFVIGYLLFSANILSKQTNVFTTWVFCTAIQLVPSLYSLITLELSAIKRKKKVTVNTKKFSLVARSIFDHISLIHLTLLCLSALVTLNIIFSNTQLGTTKQFGLSALFVVTNLLLAHRIYVAIYGKNHDKLIKDEDRTNKRNQDVQRSLLGIAAAILIFSLLGMMGAKTSNQSIWLIVPFSVFIQLAILNRSQRWHAEDMDVYKSTNL